jgi:hypothetical protein
MPASLADHGEGLLADFAIRHDVIRVVEVELVDLLAGDELVVGPNQPPYRQGAAAALKSGQIGIDGT